MRSLKTNLSGMLAVLLAVTGAGAALAADERGPFAPDIKPEALKDFRKSHRFTIVDDPKMVPAADASFLSDEDHVLAVSFNGVSRAYPTRFIGWHHGINAAAGELPYAVTYCSVCNTGIGYDLRLDGKPIHLDFYGLYNGVVALCDRETKSIFLQADGRFVNGPLLGKRLQTVPVLDVRWGEWKRLHPDTTVMSPDTPFNQFYKGPNRPEKRDRDNLSPMFIETLTHGDLRMGPFEKLLGVALTAGAVDGKTAFRAYPLKSVWEAGGAVNEETNGLPVAVFIAPNTQTGVAVSRSLEGRTLTFSGGKDAAGQFSLQDKETGSRWSVEGKAIEGPLAGKSLKRLSAHVSLWYGWAAYYPETSIFGRTDAPKPGNQFADQ